MNSTQGVENCVNDIPAKIVSRAALFFPFSRLWTRLFATFVKWPMYPFLWLVWLLYKIDKAMHPYMFSCKLNFHRKKNCVKANISECKMQFCEKKFQSKQTENLSWKSSVMFPDGSI